MCEAEKKIDYLQYILNKLVSSLNKQNICYSILGKPDGASLLDNDLDLCANEINAFERSLKVFSEKEDIKIIGKCFHATGIRYDLVCTKWNDLVFFPGPDLLIYPTWKIRGNIGLSYRELLSYRQLTGEGAFVPSVVDSFIFYLIKRIDKGDIKAKQGEYLSSLWFVDSLSIESRLRAFFLDEDVAMIVSSAKSGCWTAVVARIPKLKKALMLKEKFSLGRFFWDMRRYFKRVFSPTGLFIVFLGADGSGKSSVVTNIVKNLPPVLKDASYTHLRPRLGAGQCGKVVIVTDPHGQPTRGWWASIAKLFYFFYDYGAGYLLKVRPKLIRSTMVVFDRYYHDMLVDPRRYRYGGPMWLARLVGKLIPEPDLFVLLDAPAAVLQARKQEVTFEESSRQRCAYLELVGGMKNGVVVDASQPLDRVVYDVRGAILSFLEQRTAKRW